MIAPEHRLQTIVAGYLNASATRTAYDLPASTVLPVQAARSDAEHPQAPFLSVIVERQPSAHEEIAEVMILLECIIDPEFTTHETAATYINDARRAAADVTAFNTYLVAQTLTERQGWQIIYQQPRSVAIDRIDTDDARRAARMFEWRFILHVAAGC